MELNKKIKKKRIFIFKLLALPESSLHQSSSLDGPGRRAEIRALSQSLWPFSEYGCLLDGSPFLIDGPILPDEQRWTTGQVAEDPCMSDSSNRHLPFLDWLSFYYSKWGIIERSWILCYYEGSNLSGFELTTWPDNVEALFYQIAVFSWPCYHLPKAEKLHGRKDLAWAHISSYQKYVMAFSWKFPL